MMSMESSFHTTILIVTLRDRKSTRLNSSHDQISYAVFCLKKKKISIRMFPQPIVLCSPIGFACQSAADNAKVRDAYVIGSNDALIIPFVYVRRQREHDRPQ